jgi:hypothetical protein
MQVFSLKFRKGAASVAAASALVLSVAGCAYTGGVDKPLVQKTSWFSFLNGDDIRKACVDGAPPHYRFVYNGRYEEQVRAYDVVGDGRGGAFLHTRVQTQATVHSLTSGDLLAPWRWKSSRADLDPSAMQGFEASLKDSGFFSGAPSGLRLDSRRFYWVGVGCRNGRVWFNAWQYPSARFKALSFPQFLARHDSTGVAFNPPRYVDPSERLEDRPRKGEGGSVNFDLTVGRNGFKGLLTLF